MKYLVSFSAVLLLAGSCSAKPNFSGTWKLDASKSDFGPMPPPEKLVRTVQHDDPTVKLSTEQSNQQGEFKSEAVYTTDGKEFTNKTRFGESKGTAAWDGDTLVIKVKFSVQGTDIESTDRWTLSEDGKELKSAATMKTPQGDFEMKVTLVKQ